MSALSAECQTKLMMADLSMLKTWLFDTWKWKVYPYIEIKDVVQRKNGLITNGDETIAGRSLSHARREDAIRQVLQLFRGLHNQLLSCSGNQIFEVDPPFEIRLNF